MQMTVIGAGSMGHGIAQVSAMAGHDVRLNDVDVARIEDAVESIESNLDGGVERGKGDRGGTGGDARANRAGAGAVGGARGRRPRRRGRPRGRGAQEGRLQGRGGDRADGGIVASNTSSLSVTELASVLDRPERAVGLHFFDPAHLVDLVEAVVAEQTGETTEATAVDFVEGLGKEAVVVRDSAGFASSRLGVALGLEAIRMVEAGAAGVEDVDAAMGRGTATRWGR